MSMQTKVKNEYIKTLADGTLASMNEVIPMDFETESSLHVKEELDIQFGVLVGFTGDIKGKVILKAETFVFSSIGEKMFGMPLEGEMLSSFSGELGNMIAGGISTNIAGEGIKTDITAPTVMQGDTTLFGFNQAWMIDVTFQEIGNMDIYLIIDQILM